MKQFTTPVVMVFKKDQTANFREVRHYNLVKGEPLLSEKINISKDRKFSKSSAKYWLKIREGNKWSKNALTGLMPTSKGMIFYGDTMRKKNMVWFKFSQLGEKLTIYFFPNFYTRDIEGFINLLDN